MKDPFLEMYNTMRQASTEVLNKNTSFFIAKVVKPLPNIEIQLNDIVLDKDDLLIDKWLLDRNNELFTEVENVQETQHKHKIISNVQDKIKIGDKVVLLRVNDQFIIISKVVSI